MFSHELSNFDYKRFDSIRIFIADEQFLVSNSNLIGELVAKKIIQKFNIYLNSNLHLKNYSH